MVSSSIKSLQKQKNRFSILKFSNRPVSILSGATPHLNLTNALRCENGKAILQYIFVSKLFLKSRYVLSLFPPLPDTDLSKLNKCQQQTILEDHLYAYYR